MSELLRTIIRAGRPDFFVLGPMGIDLGASHRVPDLVIVRTEVIRTELKRVMPDDVQLAVEVVSAGSQTTDRITKPAEYAAAGIPVYLRVETRPTVTITHYELDGSMYREIGTFGAGEVARLERPFAVDIVVDDITP